MIASTKLALRYAILALIATGANIGVQDLSIRVYVGPFDITLSILMGTGIGLVIKYILDKRYIFRFNARTLSHDGKTFLLYTLMGIATTLIFWGMEFGFQWLYETKEMRYLGGVLGLTLGYVTKYQLDKHFVFRVNPS